MFCLVFFDAAMINKISKKVGGMSIRRGSSKIKSMSTKLSFTNPNVRNGSSINNESVMGGLSNADTLANKRRSTRPSSTISTVVTGSKNEAFAEVHELDVHTKK